MKAQEQRPIRIEQVEGTVDIQGAAQILALHFTQGDPMAYMMRAIQRAKERQAEEDEHKAFEGL